MIKNKFVKNLYNDISYTLTMAVLISPVFAMYFYSIHIGADAQVSWILLSAITLCILLYFLIGFYWIIQTITFDEIGMQIQLFSKVLRRVNWDDVENISCANFMQNPVYSIQIRSGITLRLDRRKRIKQAIAYYGNDHIREIVKNLVK